MSEGANKKFLSQREQFLTQNMIVIQNPQQYLATQNVNLKDPTGPLILDFDLQYDAATKFVDGNGLERRVQVSKPSAAPRHCNQRIAHSLKIIRTLLMEFLVNWELLAAIQQCWCHRVFWSKPPRCSAIISCPR